MRGLWLIIVSLIGFVAAGQISIDNAIILQGGHQVNNLSDPQANDEAMNAGAAIAAKHVFAVSIGTNSLSCTLTPAPDSLTRGMSIHLAITNTNTDSVSLMVNSFPAVPVLKGVILGLDSADLLAGMVVQLVFDGSAFQVLTTPERMRRPCPAGMAAINSQYCIELDERPALNFPDAATVCGQLGRKLCSWAEFTVACDRDTVFGLNDMIGNYEWTNTAGNGDDLVRVAGWNNCRSAGTSISVGGTPMNYRCCYRR